MKRKYVPWLGNILSRFNKRMDVKYIIELVDAMLAMAEMKGSLS
jgi:hypothetical protein